MGLIDNVKKVSKKCIYCNSVFGIVRPTDKKDVKYSCKKCGHISIRKFLKCLDCDEQVNIVKCYYIICKQCKRRNRKIVLVDSFVNGVC
jgi:hypothetical protein